MSKVKTICDKVNPFIEKRLADLEKQFPQTIDDIRKRDIDSYSFSKRESNIDGRRFCVEDFELKGLPNDESFYSVKFIHYRDKTMVRYYNSKYGWSKEYENEGYFPGWGGVVIND